MRLITFILLFFFSITNSTSQKLNIFADKTGKLGVRNTNGKIIIKPSYDIIRQNKKNYFFVINKKNSNNWDCFILNENGKKIAKTLEIRTGSFEDGFFAVHNLAKKQICVYNDEIQQLNINEKIRDIKIIGKKCIAEVENTKDTRIYSDKWELIKAYDEIKLPDKYSILPNYFTHFPVRKGNKYGLIKNDDLSELLPTQYDFIRHQSSANCIENRDILILKKSNKAGLYNTKILKLLEAEYDTVTCMDKKTFLAWKGKSFDIVDSTLSIRNFTNFDESNIVTGKEKKKFVKVKKNNLSGIMTIEGKTIVPVKYDSILTINSFDTFRHKDDVFMIFTMNGKKKGIYTAKKGELLKPVYEIIQTITDSTFFVSSDKKWSIFDRGKITQLPEYDSIYTISSWEKGVRIAVVKKADKFGLVNLDKNDTTGCLYERIINIKTPYSYAPLYIVEQNNVKRFFSTKTFNTEGPFFDELIDNYDYLRGNYLVKSGKYYHYFNSFTRNSYFDIDEIIRPFEDGYARIKSSGEYISINTNLTPVKFNEEFNDNRRALVIWIDKETAKKYNISKENPMFVEISDISSYYKMTPISRGITGGTTKPVTTVFPEDTEKEGYVKIILKKGKYRIKTSLNNTNSKYTGNSTDIDFTNEKLGIIQRLH